jgi:hypothetical protein
LHGQRGAQTVRQAVAPSDALCCSDEKTH